MYSPPSNNDAEHTDHETSLERVQNNRTFRSLQYTSLSQMPRDSLCRICLEDFKNNEALLLHVPCKTSFHAGCLLNWLKEKSTCPQCRAIMKGVPTSSSKDPTRRSPPDADDPGAGIGATGNNDNQPAYQHESTAHGPADGDSDGELVIIGLMH